MQGPARQKKRSNSQGFTLLEVLVAVIILGLGYVAILQNFSLSQRNIFRLEERRNKGLISSIEFSQKLQEVYETEQADSDAEVISEGGKFRLVKIVSDDGELETMVLEKRGELW